MIAIEINPGLALLVGALAALLAPQGWRPTVALVASLAALALAFTTSFGEHATFAQIGLKLVALRLDALSQTFGVLFALASIMLALHGADPETPAETGLLLLLAGGAMTAVYSGDFISFVAAAELSTLAAVALLLLRKDWTAQEIGMRALGWQALSSLLFLSGAAFSIVEGRGADFARLSPHTVGGALILAAFGVKAGFPVAHVWLKEATARASGAGAAGLVAFTTTLGVYGLMRGYAGEPALIWIGLVMAILPAAFAMAENDLRRALAYGLVVQTGVIVTAIGVGTPVALSAAAAHAFATVLAFILLAMALGAVRERTGSCRASDIGGFARIMPATAALAALAAASIAGLPLTAGYASLALVLEAAEKSGHAWLHFALAGAIAAAVAHTAIKIPYAAFFAPPRKALPEQGLFASHHLAMLIAAVLIVGIGVIPGWLYSFLPSEPARFAPYEWRRLAGLMQLSAFAGLAVIAARLLRVYPQERPGEVRDADWLIHGVLWRGVQRAGGLLQGLNDAWGRGEGRLGGWLAALAARAFSRTDLPWRPLAAPAAWLLFVAAAGLAFLLGYVSLQA